MRAISCSVPVHALLLENEGDCRAEGCTRDAELTIITAKGATIVEPLCAPCWLGRIRTAKVVSDPRGKIEP